MARVPVYDGPQVAPTPVQYDRADPEAFGARQGRAMEKLGATIGAAGDLLDKAIQRDALREAMDAESAAKQNYIDWSTKAIKEGQGPNAAGIKQRAEDWWGKNIAETEAKISNPMARRMFRSAAQRQMVASLGEFSRFETQQLEIDLLAKTEANVSASQALAVRVPTEDNVKLQADGIRAMLKEYGANRWSPEVLKDKTDTAIAKMHSDVFNVLLVRAPLEAKAFYEANRKAFAPSQIDEIESRLKAGVADAQGQSGAREVVDSFVRNLKITDAYPAQDIERELDKKFGSQPEVLRAARAESDRKMAIWNKQQSETTAAAVSKVMETLGPVGSDIARVKRMPEWNMMTGEQRATIEQRWFDRQELLANRREADSDRDERRRDRAERKQIEQMAPVALEMAQPQSLARMTRADIMNKAHLLGPKLTAQVLKEWESYQKDTATLNKAAIDNDIFNSLMTEAGFEPKPKASDKQKSAFAWDMRSRVKAALAAAQVAGREQLDPEKRTEIMRQVIQAEVLMPGRVYGSNAVSESTADPADVIRRGSVMISYTDKDGVQKRGPWKLADIPKKEYETMASVLREKGVPLTQQNIAQAWYNWRMTQGKK